MGDMNNHGNQTKNRPYGVGVQSPEKNVSSANHRYVQGWHLHQTWHFTFLFVATKPGIFFKRRPGDISSRICSKQNRLFSIEIQTMSICNRRLRSSCNTKKYSVFNHLWFRRKKYSLAGLRWYCSIPTPQIIHLNSCLFLHVKDQTLILKLGWQWKWSFKAVLLCITLF